MNKILCTIKGQSVTVVLDESHISFSLSRKYSAFAYSSQEVSKVIGSLVKHHPELVTTPDERGGLFHSLDSLFAELFEAANNLVMTELHMDNGEVLQCAYYKENESATMTEDGVIVADTMQQEWWLGHEKMGEIIGKINSFVTYQPWNTESDYITCELFNNKKHRTMNIRP